MKPSASALLFAFIPWTPFTAKPGTIINDHAKMRVAVAKNCAAVKDSDKNIFNVEVVNSQESRAKGLGGRKNHLAYDEGMLFLFDPPEPVNFWMKDTYIPLQIVYFDAAGKTIKAFEMPVEKNPWQPQRTYFSEKPAVAALEIAPHRLKDSARGLMLCAEDKPKK